MYKLFRSTKAAYYISLAAAFIIFLSELFLLPRPLCYIVIIITYIIFVIILFIIFISANKKYNKTLEKLSYDPTEFIREQKGFLKTPHLSEKISALIKTNIGSAYIHLDRYSEAKEFCSSLEPYVTKKSNVINRFVIMTNLTVINAHLNDRTSTEKYRTMAKNALNDIKNSKVFSAPEMVNKYEIIFRTYCASADFFLEKNHQTADELLKCIDPYYDIKQEVSGYKDEVSYHYIKGYALTVLGEHDKAREHFEYITKIDTKLPCAERVRNYLNTGDQSCLDA